MKKIFILFVAIFFHFCLEISKDTNKEESFSIKQIKDGMIYEVYIRQYLHNKIDDQVTQDTPKLKNGIKSNPADAHSTYSKEINDKLGGCYLIS